MSKFKEISKTGFWIKLGKVAWQSALNFSEDNCMKMSASLAYYTVFSIGPLILIVSWVIGFLYGQHFEDTHSEDQLLSELNHLFGENITSLIQNTLENLKVSASSKTGIIVGTLTLIFTSTTVFVEIQDSINTIWGIKPKPKKNWLRFILNRLTSLSMVLGLGFLLIASLMINSIVLLLMKYFNQIIPGISNNLLEIINSSLTLVIIASIFSFIFKFLPDAKVRNRDIIIGAVFTTILFMLGRYGISIYLQNNATASAFGAAGAVILLLLWIYYSAAILYYGAEFTKEHSKVFGDGIIPASFAVRVSRTEELIVPDENNSEK